MLHRTGTFRGTDNCNLFYQYYLPAVSPRAVLFLAHGISEHSGRYAGLSQFLASQGVAVFGFDYRHHGRSEGEKGRMDRFSHILDDFSNFLDIIRDVCPGKKIFLLGHSMGASLSLAYTQKAQSGLAGLVLSGTPLRSLPSVPVAVIGCLYPLVLLTPNLGFYKLKSSTLSRDPQIVTGYDNDPLVFRGKLACSLIISFMWTLHKIESKLNDIKIPVLILHGDQDSLCSPKGSEIVFNSIGSKEKTHIPYKGLYHEILNEPEKEKVYADILTWLNERI
ncbi:MAG TPA: lysophospholipase [Dehalococcoidales bacterium]|nr:lysophospholipase [Dehalococcoidales bacterium]